MVVNGTIAQRWALTIYAQVALILAFVFITVGCASSDNTLQYYLLHSTSASSNLNSVNNHNELLLKKIVLPEYLKQRGLVYQTSETNIHIATDHLWAEPIEQGIEQTLKQAFQTNGIRLLTSHVGSQTAHNQLILRIDDFIATWQGDVILRGQYELINTRDNAPITREFYIILPLEKDGFSSSVIVMRHAITQLAEQISKALE